MILTFWNIEWLYVKVTQKGRISLFKGLFYRKKTPQGWAYRTTAGWFLVYENEAMLYFKTGNFKIPIGNNYNVENKKVSVKKRVFLIKRLDEIIFSNEYTALPMRMYAQSDPTYDDIDEQNEDFFIWVTNLWRDKEMQENLVKL